MATRPRLSRLPPSMGSLVLATAVATLAVLVMMAVWQAVHAERSHRATAQRTVRDYAAVAAWHFAQRANQLLHDLGGPTLAAIDPGSGRAAQQYHPAVLLARDTAVCAAADRPPSHFAFRLDLAERTILTAGSPLDPAALRELAAKVPPLMTRGGAERHRFIAPTVGGRPLPLAAMLVATGEPANEAAAVYGFAFDSSELARQLTTILTAESLLPPALIRQDSGSAQLGVAVRTPDGYSLFASGPTPARGISAVDSTHAAQGRLAVEVSLDPALGPSLVIGGLPASRLPALYAFVAAALLLAGVGFVQLRRERQLMQLRSRFVANVSHELRTPLTQISMFGETLMHGRARTEEEGRHFAAVISREARRLSLLVDDVLRFSRSEAGGTALHLEPRLLSAELREATDHFAPIASALGTSVVRNVDPELVVLTDSGALRQIMMNLLENAAKYGPHGQTITVAAHIDGAHTLVTIDDAGPGIPAPDRRRVLEPFTRLERPDRPQVAGTGIGLAVVDDLVRAHGGELWITDAPRGGARVCFTLRLASLRPTGS